MALVEVPYELRARDHVDRIFAKMRKKDRHGLEMVYKKLEEVSRDPKKFKPLNAPMQNLRRVHVLGSFVITYSIDKSTHSVWIEDFAHHDEIYE